MSRTLASSVATVRRFNRFYTRRIGALGQGHLGTPFSLTEGRVLYEIANGDGVTASEVMRALALDPGYTSRLISRFIEQGLVRSARSPADGRRKHLSLTRKGRAAFAKLDERATADIAEMLDGLAPPTRAAVVGALTRVHRALEPDAAPDEPYTLRGHRPGDMGWVVHRHGVLYAQEYGWNEKMEALIARVVADFIDHLDPARERCWIAERHGEIVGSVLVVKQSARVGKLRLLLVEPSARGFGLGRRLVDECIAFARAAGYRKMVLWTQSNLTAARQIYRTVGFQLVASEKHSDFGPELVSESWELEL